MSKYTELSGAVLVILLFIIIGIGLGLSGCQTGQDNDWKVIQQTGYIGNSWDANGNYSFTPNFHTCRQNVNNGMVVCN